MEPMIIDLPDHAGALIPVSLAESRNDAMRLFRDHVTAVWGWDTPGNFAVEGPHHYVCFPPVTVEAADYRDEAEATLRGSGIPFDKWDEAVTAAAQAMAEAAATPGGWRRSMFSPDELPSGRFWKATPGIAGT